MRQIALAVLIALALSACARPAPTDWGKVAKGFGELMKNDK